MFRKILKSTIIIATFVTLGAWADNEKLIEATQQKAVNLLRQLDKLSYADFDALMASEEETLAFADSALAGEEDSSRLRELLKNRATTERQKYYEELKDIVERFQIQWSEVKPIGIEEDKIPDSFTDIAIQGDFYFSINGKYFEIEVGGFVHDGKYYLLGIKDLSNVSPQEIPDFAKQRQQ